MRARGFVAAGCVLLGGLAQLATPLTALLTLDARPFGQFAVVYLMFAWGLSLQLSICSEPFVRHRISHGSSPDDRSGFHAASSAVGLTLGVVTALLAAVIWSWALAATAAVAVTATIVRLGSRYQAVVERSVIGAVRGDVVFVIGFAAASLALHGRVDGPMPLMAAWATAATASLVLGSPWGLPRPRAVLRWVRDHSDSIRPLLKDSLLLDASAIGGAYLLLPLLSVVEFGIYRAVSNVATPARLVTDAVRPLLGQALSPRRQRLLINGVVALGIIAAVVAGLAILVIDRQGLDLGVVNELAPYAAQTGLYVGASIIGAVFYFQARAHATAHLLWRGRLWQSGSAFVGPLLGAATTGLPGAITGTALAAAFGAAVWWGFAHRSLPGGRSLG